MVATWEYADSQGFPIGMAAIGAAKLGTLGTLDAPTRARYVRSLLVQTMGAGLMGLNMPRKNAEAPIELGAYSPQNYMVLGIVDKNQIDIASTILRTPQVLIPKGAHFVSSLRTTDGAPAELVGDPSRVDVALAPLVIIAGIALVAVASVVIAQIAGNVVDRQNERTARNEALLKTHANALEVLSKHFDREKEQKQAIPWAPVEVDVIEGLMSAQMEILKHEDRPLPVPFQGASDGVGKLLGGAGDLLHGVGAGVGDGLSMAVPVAIAAAGVYFLAK